MLAKSTICTWPVFRAGNANNELLLLGHSTHKPNKIRQKHFFFHFRKEDKKTLIYKFNTLHLKSVCSKQDWTIKNPHLAFEKSLQSKTNFPGLSVSL